MSSPPRLTCTGLTIAYDDFVAVDGVSFSVAAGEILGLLGPNGAGKTSVIRALTTIVPTRAGTARIAGHELADATGVRSVIGVLPESNGYPGAHTGRSYLRFYGQLFGLDRDAADDRALGLLEQLGLGGNERPISTYSRGMRQRLGLCRALVNRPEVLFLDEPTLGLDPAGQDEIMRHFSTTAAEQGTAVVLCSHLLDEVERVCDRVAIMHEGSIVAEGTVDAVVAAAGIGGYATIGVRPGDLLDATNIVSGHPAVAKVDIDPARVGSLHLELSDPEAGGVVLRLLLDRGIVPRSFDLEGARLSDAFLALTGARADTATS